MNEKTKTPRQKRAIQTKNLIIKTAITIFSEKGYHNTSSNEISKAAGVSIGAFYSHFKDKKQLFIEAIEYFSSQMEEGIDYTVFRESHPKEIVLTELIKSVFSAHRIMPEFHQEITAMCLLDKDINETVTRQDRQKLERAYNLLTNWEAETKVSDLHVAAFFIHTIMESIIHAAIFNDTDISEELLIKELVHIIMNYLF